MSERNIHPQSNGRGRSVIGQASAQQIVPGDKLTAAQPGNRHRLSGIVVVDHPRQPVGEQQVGRNGTGRRQQTVTQRRIRVCQQYAHGERRSCCAGDVHVARFALMVVERWVGGFMPAGSGQLRVCSKAHSRAAPAPFRAARRRRSGRPDSGADEPAPDSAPVALTCYHAPAQT